MKTWRIAVLSVLLIVGMALPAASAGAANLPVPGLPSDVHAHGMSQTVVMLTWKAPSDAGIGTVYRVTTERHLGSLWQAINVADYQTPTLAKITGLVNGATYRFKVQAFSRGWGSTPAWSNVVTLSGPAPLPPTSVLAAAADRSVTVSWMWPGATPGSPAVDHFLVLVYGSAGGPVLQYVDSIQNAPAYNGRIYTTITGLTNGATYVVEIYAVGTSWMMSTAATVIASPIPNLPRAPQNLQVTRGNGTATAFWDPPFVGSGQLPIDHYVVSFFIGSQRVWGPAVVHGTQITAYGLSNGTTYRVEVCSVDTGSWMSQPAVTTMVAQASAPQQPANVTATASNGLVVVTWTAPYDGGSPITGYRVTAYVGMTMSVAASVMVPATSNGATLQGLSTGTWYTFAVQASNAVGSGPESLRSNSMMLATVPGLPLNVFVGAGIGQAIISWSPPVSDGGSPITGYLVTASTGLPGEATSMSVEPGTTTVTIGSLIAGRTYSFTVVATNAIGKSAPSIPSGSITLPAAPSEPRNLSITPGDQSITVRWDTPASSGGLPITMYRVTVSNATSTPLVIVVSSTSATVTGLTNGVGYIVSVVALNGVGAGGTASAMGLPQNTPPTLSVPSTLTIHHGAVVSFTVQAKDVDSSDHLALSAVGLPQGVTFTDRGNGTGTVQGNAEVAAGTYTISFFVNDGHNTPVVQTTTLTVIREHAVVLPLSSNVTAIGVRTGSDTAKSVTFRATIYETTDPNAKADIGEAAPVTYTLTSVDSGRTYSGTANQSGGGVEANLATSYTFHTLPVGAYHLTISVGGQYYEGSGESVLLIYNLSGRGSAQGSGTVSVNNLPTYFSFHARHLKNGRAQGDLTFVEPPMLRDYTMTSTSVDGFLVKNHHVYVVGTAKVGGAGAYHFMIRAVDNHTRALKDQIGIWVSDTADGSIVDECTFATADLMTGQILAKNK